MQTQPPDAAFRGRSAFKSDETVLLCLSSAWHRRFVADLVATMALPPGARLRVRYGSKYCSDDIRRWDFRKARALFAFVDTTRDPTTIVPIRTADVVGVHTLGSVTYADLRLQDYVSFDASQLEKDLKQGTSRLPVHDPSGGSPPGHFLQIFSASPTSLVVASSVADWESLAQRLFALIPREKLPYLLNVIMPAHSATKDVGRLRRLMGAGRAARVSDGVLHLPAGTVSELQIRTLLHTELLANRSIVRSVAQLEVLVHHSDCELASPSKMQLDTRANLEAVQISARTVVRPTRGHVDVSGTAVRDADSQSPSPADEQYVHLSLPVQVGAEATVWTAAALASAFIVFGVSVQDLAEHPWWTLIRCAFGVMLFTMLLRLGLKAPSSE